MVSTGIFKTWFRDKKKAQTGLIPQIAEVDYNRKIPSFG